MILIVNEISSQNGGGDDGVGEEVRETCACFREVQSVIGVAVVAA